jgi:hypothetical protein
MRSIRFDAFSRSAPNALEDTLLAVAILAGAASVAEAAIATNWALAKGSPPPTAAGHLRKIIAACGEFERAIAGGSDV